jgi:ribonuclease BN (tRNA processing enzyme)
LGQLDLAQMLKIDHIFISHAHLDHIAALPLFLDSVMASRAQQQRPPVRVYALMDTLHSLRKHIFNREIWPDFTALPSRAAPVLELVPVQIGQTVAFSDLPYQIEVLPAEHSVPAAGYAVRAQAGAATLVYTGDTGPNPRLWQRLAQMPVAGLILETAFSNQDAALARAALHLSPSSLATELKRIAPDSRYPIYLTHAKPAQAAHIQAEVAQLAQQDPELAAILTTHPLTHLQCGQLIQV